MSNQPHEHQRAWVASLVPSISPGFTPSSACRAKVGPARFHRPWRGQQPASFYSTTVAPGFLASLLTKSRQLDGPAK